MDYYLAILHENTVKISKKYEISKPGADMRFSRRVEADVLKVSKIFIDLFLVDQIDFPSSPRALKRPCFGQILCAAGKF